MWMQLVSSSIPNVIMCLIIILSSFAPFKTIYYLLESCDDCSTCLCMVFCPCFSLCQASKDIDEDCNGYVYFAATLLGFGCCSLMALASDVARKRDIELSCCSNCINSTFDSCCCFSCTAVHECKVYKDNKASAPQAAVMGR